MSKSFEAIQLKAHGILEAVKECEEWKNTYQPLENFGKRYVYVVFCVSSSLWLYLFIN